MPYCGFCGKLCPTVPGVNRHINITPKCKKASCEEFSRYVNDIWDNVPENLNDMEWHPLPNLPNELELQIEDFHLEEDIQIVRKHSIENLKKLTYCHLCHHIPSHATSRPQWEMLLKLKTWTMVIAISKNSLRNTWLALHGGTANRCMRLDGHVWYSDISREPAHQWCRAIASGKIGALEAGSCGMYEGINGEPYIQEFAGIHTTKTLYRWRRE